ncbi:hypothetical protein PAL_GLEAN10022789 [Pteropus alecto]|uniref:Uncharacterized protein n=1 Tax=Pteropus alecto TaxID=9402 RepID=L5K495_PTEAL|nr:hypothetical protein PAL_GLEAN10022789 [Pteropus alecto]
MAAPHRSRSALSSPSFLPPRHGLAPTRRLLVSQYSLLSEATLPQELSPHSGTEWDRVVPCSSLGNRVRIVLKYSSPACLPSVNFDASFDVQVSFLQPSPSVLAVDQSPSPVCVLSAVSAGLRMLWGVVAERIRSRLSTVCSGNLMSHAPECQSEVWSF